MDDFCWAIRDGFPAIRLRVKRAFSMILTCPECTTSFDVAAELLGPDGRRVKCHKCNHIWMAKAEQLAETGLDEPGNPEPGEETPEMEMEVGLDDLDVRVAGTEEDAPGDNETIAEPDDFGAVADDDKSAPVSEESGDPEDSQEKPAKEDIPEPEDKPVAADIANADIEKLALLKQVRARLPGGGFATFAIKGRRVAVIAAGILILVGGLVMFREPMVRIAPGMVRLYALAGVEVNLRGLEFRDIAFARDYEDGLSVLTVRGEIVNITDAPVMLPMIRFSLRDDREQEIYHWTGSAGSDFLQPAGAVPFETRLASPPQAQDIFVRFAR